MPDEDRRNLASNNPYGDAYRHQWGQEAQIGETPPDSGPINPELAQHILAQEARRFLARTEPLQTDPEQAWPARQEPTLPAYHEQAATWERPSDTWAAAADQDARDRLRDWDRQQGRGAPTAEDPNQWDYQTMDPAQAAAAVAGTLQQPSAPAQSSAYSQSYQGDQPQGYAGGATLSPEQAAYFSQQMAQSQPHSADPPLVDVVTRAVNQRAYEQAQAFSAADFPGRDLQEPFQPAQPNVVQPQAYPEVWSPSPNQAQAQYQPQNPPTNPFAGPANDSLSHFDPHGARAAPLRDSNGPGLNRRPAVRRPPNTQERPQGGRARGGSSR